VNISNPFQPEIPIKTKTLTKKYKIGTCQVAVFVSEIKLIEGHPLSRRAFY
jgi:ureidoglycolate hydrolase